MIPVHEVLATWRDAERLLDTLPPLDPDHETVRMLVIALRESYERVTDGSARTTPGAIARSLETVVESRGLLAQVRAKHPADGLPADGLAADGLGPASTY